MCKKCPLSKSASVTWFSVTYCSVFCARCCGSIVCGLEARLCGPSMGQQPHFSGTMNPGTMNSPAKTSARASGYHQKAMAEIHNSLLPFAKSASSASDFAKNEFTKNNSNNNSGAPENIGSSAASTISTLSTTSGVSSASGMSTGSNNGNGLNADIRQSLQQLVAMGYAEVSLI